ncbi:MAG: sialate O-acetylesterase [Candidatus Neomarinimicrobiota bacterium]
MNGFIINLLLFIMTQSLFAQTTWQVYFLAGQSNMDGLGTVSDLPAELTSPDSTVMIFHGNSAPDGGDLGGLGKWSPLRPGHGWGFWFDGAVNHYSDLFGLELSFARRLRELQPAVPIALVKYSRAGTSIDTAAADVFGCWTPDFDGTNQFDHFLTTVRNALAVEDIDGDGRPDRLVPAGLIWMQGESDALYSAAIAERYQHNLARLVQAVRDELGNPDLPVAIGRISDSGQDGDGKFWDHAGIVRAAQAGFVAQDHRAALITDTDSYGYVADGAHYDSPSLIALGQAFAEAIQRLNSGKR